MLSDQDLNDALNELGRRAHAQGKVLEIAVYGGSALMLASNFRIATQDVDAVADTDQDLVDRLANEIAAERSWPQGWLNDGVRTYLSPKVDGLAQHHRLFRTYPSEQMPGLRVFVPTPEYLLAMKLMAMRLDPAAGKSDVQDILNLIEVLGITDKDQLRQFAAAFYPEARVSAASTLVSISSGQPTKPAFGVSSMRPATLAEVARRRNKCEQLGPLLAEFLDTFYGALHNGAAQPLIDDEPERLPDAQEHALLGGVAEHLARRWELSIPDWSSRPNRFLARPYFTTPLEGFKALLLAESPLAFRRRLIFTEAEPLRRATMPRTDGKQAPA